MCVCLCKGVGVLKVMCVCVRSCQWVHARAVYRLHVWNVAYIHNRAKFHMDLDNASDKASVSRCVIVRCLGHTHAVFVLRA